MERFTYKELCQLEEAVMLARAIAVQNGRVEHADDLLRLHTKIMRVMSSHG